ncbi:MAG: hypothetical protein ACREBC_15195 [Pyrinomonadaceae bacterium]
MSLLSRLSAWFEKKPLVVLRFEDGVAQALSMSKQGLNRFTLAKPHEAFDKLKLPTLCLAEFRDGKSRKCYVGVVESTAPITTFESRLTVIKLQALSLTSLKSLDAKLSTRGFRTALKNDLASDGFALTPGPKLSAAVIEGLSKDPENRKAIEAAAFNLPKLRRMSTVQWEQVDAIETAVAAFGLSKSAFPALVEIAERSDSALKCLDSHALEDNVIARDASVIEGYSLIEKHVTGLAVFKNGNERLDVYTANKGPLEKMLGVDLIYMNETVGNTVMVQYKMLERSHGGAAAATDWIFRPNAQFKKEVARMRLLPVAGEIADYRLHPSPFFFKFVKRKGDGESHQSFIVTVEHLNQMLASWNARGPNNGVRVSYETLDGAYLRESDLIGLIRSGYIGTHRIESAALTPSIAEVAKGNRALVLAWQRRL